MSVYEIRVKGHLDPRWSEWFDGLRITNEPNGETLLSGYIADQGRRCQCTIRLIAVAERPLQLTLVFDGTCGFCTRSVRLLEALDRNRRVTAVPFQKSSVPASVGLTLQECKAAAWAIASDGGRYRGAEAVNAVVAAALGSTLPLLLYSLPGIRQLLDFIYYLVASNRSRLPGDLPYCAQHPAECR